MTLRPSFDALRARVLRNFTGVGVPKGERVEGLNVEVLLSPDEARRGGALRLGIPVFAPCTICAGTGHAWSVSCLACMGEGMIEQEEVVAVRLPLPLQRLLPEPWDYYNTVTRRSVPSLTTALVAECLSLCRGGKRWEKQPYPT